jgi:hypothetical protein
MTKKMTDKMIQKWLDLCNESIDYRDKHGFEIIEIGAKSCY